MPLETMRVSQEEAVIIEELVFTYIVESKEYKVIDRKQRDNMLKEIEFSMNADASKQLELGKFLSADGIITGTIGKIESTYVLTLKLIKIVTGQTVNTASGTYNSMEKLLADSKRLTWEVLGLSEKRTVTNDTWKDLNTTEDFFQNPAFSHLTGKWQGDKGLKTIRINSNGTAEAITSEKSVLIRLKVSIQGSKIIFDQAQTNKPDMYTSIVPYKIAEQLSKVARPMRWVFQLSADKQKLIGIKETTWFQIDQATQKILQYDNTWSRPAVWIRE